MNKVILMGRLTREPEVRQAQETTVARYTLAANRRFREGETDFINCVAFGKNAEFAEKWLRKGVKIVIAGRIQTGSYTNRDGVKVYTTDVVVEEQEFAESKATGEQSGSRTAPSSVDAGEGFMNIPEGIDEELPFD